MSGGAVQRYLWLSHVTVHRHGGVAMLAVVIPALGQINYRFLAPVGLIPIEDVLFGLTVKGHQALHVSSRYPSAVGHRGGKVEGVPQVRGDDVRMLGYGGPLILVGFGLESLRIVRLSPVERLAKVFRLMGNVGIGTVFTQHELLPGIVFLQPLNPRVDVPDFALIPAKVAIHALNIGVLVYGVLCDAVSVDRHRHTVGVFGLGQVVERCRKLGTIVRRAIDLVVQSPYIDAGVVETLAYQFAQLAVTVFPLLAGHPVYKGYFTLLLSAKL